MDHQFTSAFDGLVGLDSTVELPFAARDHKKAFAAEMKKRHA